MSHPALKNLNAEQRAAVLTEHGNVLVLASPGSGKTRSLVHRILHLVCQGVAAEQIVAITFTNVAADEIRERIDKMVPGLSARLGYVGTLHSYCLRLLGRFGSAIGFRQNVVVIDEERADELLIETVREIGYKLPIKELDEARRRLGPSGAAEDKSKAGLVIARYYQNLKRGNAIDYDGLLSEALRMLEKIAGANVEHDGWLRKTNEFPRIAHLLGDEFQDDSDLDWRIFQALRAENYWLVGDPDQAIYSFRGGRMANILALADTPAWEKHFFLANYRSDHAICEGANRLIHQNCSRVAKSMRSASQIIGDIRADGYRDEDDEIFSVFWKIANLHDHEGFRHEDVAILVRSNALAMQFRDAARARGVPVAQDANPERDVPGWKFARLSVDMLASPGNDFVFRHWLTMKEGAEAASRLAQQAGLARASMAGQYFVGGIPPAPYLAELPARLLSIGVAKTAIVALDLLMPSIPPGAGLTEISLAMRSATFNAVPGGSPGGMTITTIHAAKGREWLAVFLPAMEEGILPNARAVREPGGMEEERRLAFVGVTRAARRLYVSYAAKRAPQWGKRVFQPATRSPFIAELID